jgi:VanZ family protein
MGKAGNTRWRERIVRFAPVVVWVLVIFFLSSSQGSMSKTSLFVRPLLEFLFPAADEVTLQIYHGHIRKAAHVTEYAVLAFLASRAFFTSARPFLKKYWWLLALVTVAAVAATDEFNQSFNTARTGTPWDVGIDLVGGLVGTALWALADRFRGRIATRRSSRS